MVNCNPETVSTDYDTSDLLFFEPLTHEDVLNISEGEPNRVLADRTKAWIRDNPGKFVQLFVRKFVLTHNRETMGIVWNEQSLSRYLSPTGIMAAKAVSTLYWWAALALGVAGALMVLGRERWLGLFHPAVMIWAYFAFVHAVTQASDRYHLPSVPFIAMLAGFALAEAWRRWGARRPEAAGPALAEARR